MMFASSFSSRARLEIKSTAIGLAARDIFELRVSVQLLVTA